MYIVTIQNNGVSTPIHNSKEKLTSGKITKGINVIDSFQFSMLPTNAGYEGISDYTTLVKVYNTNRDRYEFHGRVLYSEDTMSENGAISKDVICESFIGFFCDSQQEYIEARNWTVGGLLQHIVNTHNKQVESYKQFTIGEVTVTDANDNIYCGIQRENTWKTIQDKLINTLGGEIRFRVDGDIIYLDYLAEIGEKSSTEIALSKNMKSISRERDPSEIVTRLIPLGCKLTTKDDEGQEKETEQRLDITSVNDGKNYIDDENAIALYGIRVGIVEFDDVTVPSTLLSKGMKWLAANNKLKTSYTATALDLSLLGLEVDDFDVCNYHPLKNSLLGIDDTVRIIKKSIDVCEEIKSTIEFGDNVEKLSDAMKKQSDALNLITSDYVTNEKFENANKKTYTKIEQTEEKINLVIGAESLVDENGEVQGGLLIEAINSEVVAKIAAERLDIEGKELNIKVDAANITGKLTADQINADGIEATDVNVTGTINATAGTFSGNISTSLILLENRQIKLDSDDEGTVTKIKVDWEWITSNAGGAAVATAEAPVPVDSEVYFVLFYKGHENVGAGGTAIIRAGTTQASISFTWASGYTYDSSRAPLKTEVLSFSESGTLISIDSGIMPAKDSEYLLGTPNRKWTEIYADTEVINTSDEREKNSIEEIPQKYSDMFYKLNPIIYKLNKGKSGRYHVGMSAQEVEKAMTDCGVTDMEFGGLIKSPYTDKDGNADYKYGLRYGEFISLAILEIQRLNEKIIELERKLGDKQ